MDDLDAREGILKRSVTMDVYHKLGDQSMLKLYRIARQCGDFATVLQRCVPVSLLKPLAHHDRAFHYVG